MTKITAQAQIVPRLRLMLKLILRLKLMAHQGTLLFDEY